MPNTSYGDLFSRPFAFADLLSSYEVSNQISAIEDLIAQGASLPIIIRLLCLATIVNGGIKTKTLEGIKREILQVPLAFHSPLYPHSFAYRLLASRHMVTKISHCFSRFPQIPSAWSSRARCPRLHLPSRRSRFRTHPSGRVCAWCRRTSQRTLTNQLK